MLWDCTACSAQPLLQSTVSLIGILTMCSNIGGGGSGNPLSAITSGGGLSSITSAIAGAPFGLAMHSKGGLATLKSDVVVLSTTVQTCTTKKSVENALFRAVPERQARMPCFALSACSCMMALQQSS